MLRRAITHKLHSLATTFPVISITGPRQSGKTTLAKAVFPEHVYVSLEDPNEYDAAVYDPKGYLRRFSGGVILDEVQRTPLLLSCIQGIVDNNLGMGRFVLTGSQQFHLMNKVTQTLAGRTALVNLYPFSLDELLERTPFDPWQAFADIVPHSPPPVFTLEEIMLKGLYPPLHDRGGDPQDWYGAYYRTYIERDLRSLINIGNLNAFQRFVRLCAGRSGQLLNLSSLAQDAGISHTTARSWISALEAAFIVHLLPPHFANFSKRIVKTPKLYFFDSGLLCYLLRIRTQIDLMTHAMRGAIFETFVVSEFFKAFAQRGEIPPLYFWRDQTGHEVDLVIDLGNQIFPVEIKSGETVDASFFKGLKYYNSLMKSGKEQGLLIYGGTSLYDRQNYSVCPWYLIP